ncbi:hypothetical protein [Tepidibacter formicigenes]|jgi:hypothetical protein|uniref:Uncharacterized protein n=1 Tax=Tepidibacter formicigenes DSM 15518 TaxID=1123349 RepID=A0A1M6LUC6_9FIRM|nr:hypothetical protein [Tepidibacter formicigenes]SHJ74868.1 hypothetical protein SAMN02744037_00738 [Tepidibacter formicigenes DSM 15518]
MQIATFNATCPFEIGDKVKEANTGEVKRITDIACVHYLKTGKVEFRYELDGSGNYIQIQPLCDPRDTQSVTYLERNFGFKNLK